MSQSRPRHLALHVHVNGAREQLPCLHPDLQMAVLQRLPFHPSSHSQCYDGKGDGDAAASSPPLGSEPPIIMT